MARRGEAFDREAADLDVDAGTVDRDHVLAAGRRRRENDRRLRGTGADERQALARDHLLGEVAGAHLDPSTLCSCGHGGLDRRVGRAACRAYSDRRGRLRSGLIRPTKAEAGEEYDEPGHAFRQSDRYSISPQARCSTHVPPSDGPRTMSQRQALVKALCYHARRERFRLRKRKPRECGAFRGGRYWARTSDPQLVELVLSQLS